MTDNHIRLAFNKLDDAVFDSAYDSFAAGYSMAEQHQKLIQETIEDDLRKRILEFATISQQQAELLELLEGRALPPGTIAPVKQAHRHRPAEGIYGDCYRTCLAALCGMRRDDVPHWHEAMSAQEANYRYGRWLGARGLSIISVAFNGENPEAVMQALYSANPAPCIFSGTSRNGTNHAVLALHGKLWHDPSLDDTGIIGPCDDGYYWAEWVVRFPANLSQADFEASVIANNMERTYGHED